MLGIGVLCAASAVAGDAAADESCLAPSAGALSQTGASSLAAVLTAGRADLKAGRTDDAAARFRSVAFGQADTATGLEATSLYLEALNVLGNQGRTACWDDMARDVPLLRETWCNESLGQSETETCVLVENVHWDVVRLRAQKLVEEADKKGPGVPEVVALYERGGQIYAEAFRDACETPVRTTKKPRLARASSCEELAYNAARAFTAARLRVKAIAMYRSLIAYGDLVGPSSLIGRAMHDLAGAYQAIAMYDLAADWHERFATKFPKEYYADESMNDAVILRLGLGEYDAAVKDVGFFLETWGKSKRNESAALVLALAAHHVERDEKEKARVTLAARMDSFEHGPLDLRIRAHALLAKITPARAKGEWGTVRALWSDPKQAERQLRAWWPSEDQARVDRRLAYAITAVGEAMVFAADEKRTTDVDTSRYPAFSGTGDRAGIEAFVRDKVKEWFDKKLAAITATEPEYIKVVEIQPVPPPKSVIAAAANVAKMWAGLADDLANPPINDSLRRDRALFRAYLTAAAPMIERARMRHAKPAMQKCIDLSVKYQIPDSAGRDCEAWLVKSFPDEWHRVDEIVPDLRVGPRTSPASPLPALLEPR